MGRGRAWLRLAMMQKKIADYLYNLLARKDILRFIVFSCKLLHSPVLYFVFEWSVRAQDTRSEAILFNVFKCGRSI